MQFPKLFDLDLFLRFRHHPIQIVELESFSRMDSLIDFIFICVVVFSARGLVEMQIFKLVNSCLILLVQNMVLFPSYLTVVLYVGRLLSL